MIVNYTDNYIDGVDGLGYKSYLCPQKKLRADLYFLVCKMEIKGPNSLGFQEAEAHRVTTRDCICKAKVF